MIQTGTFLKRLAEAGAVVHGYPEAKGSRQRGSRRTAATRQSRLPGAFLDESSS